MAITGPASYVGTTETFLTHWLAVDTALGLGNFVTVTGGVGRGGLQTLYTDLLAKRTDLQSRLIDEEIARGDVDLKKEALLVRINQFNERIRGAYAGTKWERVLRLVPAINDAQSKFTDPLDGTARLWQRINTDATPPVAVLLQGGYSQAQFVTDIAALKTAFAAWTAAATDTKITLEDRNDLQDKIYPVLKDYRSTMPTYFVTGHALADSLPSLTPAPGSTPDAVTAAAVWLPTTQQAKITWSAPASANVSQIEIRFCAGPTYDTDLESVIGNVAPSAPREFLTATGLAAPGSQASFRVYVITDTLNEKGSNTLLVTRPLEAPGPGP